MGEGTAEGRGRAARRALGDRREQPSRRPTATAPIRWGPVTGPGLSEQQRIADAFHAEGLIPVKLNTTAIKIWSPKGS